MTEALRKSHEFEDLGEIELERKVYVRGVKGDAEKGIAPIQGGFTLMKVKRHMVDIFSPNSHCRVNYADAVRLGLLSPRLVDSDGETVADIGELSLKEKARRGEERDRLQASRHKNDGFRAATK
jgi:hypothetical protein